MGGEQSGTFLPREGRHEEKRQDNRGKSRIEAKCGTNLNWVLRQALWENTPGWEDGQIEKSKTKMKNHVRAHLDISRKIEISEKQRRIKIYKGELREEEARWLTEEKFASRGCLSS